MFLAGRPPFDACGLQCWKAKLVVILWCMVEEVEFHVDINASKIWCLSPESRKAEVGFAVSWPSSLDHLWTSRVLD